MINGVFKVDFPTPHGSRNSMFTLKTDSGILTGTLTNPLNPDDVAEIEDGTVAGNNFRFHARTSDAGYEVNGLIEDGKLKFDVETHEEKHIAPGKRLNGITGRVPGEYLVGLYSPGGTKENHFVLVADGNKLSGEMYCVMTEKDLAQMQEMMSKMPKTGAAGPGGPPGLPGGMKLPEPGEKMDVSALYDGTLNGNDFTIFTRTAMGQVFKFTGNVTGDTIYLNMQVTDILKDVTGVPVA